MLNDIYDFKWDCYTRGDRISIYNCMNRDRNHDNSESDSKEKVDGQIVDIIEELYPIIALENIDTHETQQDKKRLAGQVEVLAKKHNALLRLKQLYYTEVQESIDRINEYLCQDAEIEEELFGVIEWFYSTYRDDWAWYEQNFRWGSNRLRALLDVNPKLYKKIANAIIDIQIFEREHHEYHYGAKRIAVWFQFFSLLRSEEFALAGEVSWLCFLLDIYNHACGQETLLWFENYSEGEWQSQLDDLIDRTTRAVESTLSMGIVQVQKNMVLCYTAIPICKDSLETKLKILIDAIVEIANSKEGKKYKRYVCEEPKGCIATMHCDEKRYVAISGGEYWSKCIGSLRNILGSDYIVVDLNSDVRYYYTERDYVTYKEYSEWKKRFGIKETKQNSLARMFSCCERKLLTQLYDQDFISYVIYVRMKMCKMCELAVSDYELTNYSYGLINFPEGANNFGQVEEILLKWLNSVAKKIKNDEALDELALFKCDILVNRDIE